MTTSFATIPTPAGPFTLIADGDGTVLASGWADSPRTLIETIGRAKLPALAAALDAGAIDRRDEIGDATRAVRDYLDGDLGAIERVAVDQRGGAFTARAWQELRAIPAGQSRTYAQLAERCGSPNAVRAAGSACGANRVALFVPCHRALRTDGTLGGFLYGLDVKRWLLAHERAAAGAASANGAAAGANDAVDAAPPRAAAA